MGKVHRLKFKGVDLCNAVYSGMKTHEVRYNDRDYRTGDLILPIALEDSLTPIMHPINNMVYEVGYVSQGTGIAEGYCVFSIKLSDKKREDVEPYSE